MAELRPVSKSRPETRRASKKKRAGDEAPTQIADTAQEDELAPTPADSRPAAGEAFVSSRRMNSRIHDG
jgi:hypothetical protein